MNLLNELKTDKKTKYKIKENIEKNYGTNKIIFQFNSIK